MVFGFIPFVLNWQSLRHATRPNIIALLPMVTYSSFCCSPSKNRWSSTHYNQLYWNYWLGGCQPGWIHQFKSTNWLKLAECVHGVDLRRAIIKKYRGAWKQIENSGALWQIYTINTVIWNRSVGVVVYDHGDGVLCVCMLFCAAGMERFKRFQIPDS